MIQYKKSGFGGTTSRLDLTNVIYRVAFLIKPEATFNSIATP